MKLLDYIILAVLIIGAVIGLIFGVKKKLTKKLGWLGGFIVAIMFSAMLSNLILSNTPLGQSGAEFFANKMLEGADENTATILNMSYADFISYGGADSDLAQGLSAMGVPTFFASFFISKIYLTTDTIAMALGSGVTAAISGVVTFVALYVISSIIFVILLRLFLGGTDDKKSLLDRIAGMIYYTAAAGVLIFVVMVIVTGISIAVPSLDTWLRDQTSFTSGNVTISGLFYKYAWQIVNSFVLAK